MLYKELFQTRGFTAVVKPLEENCNMQEESATSHIWFAKEASLVQENFILVVAIIGLETGF